jgi:phospholipid transport system substrate-binding protein
MDKKQSLPLLAVVAGIGFALFGTTAGAAAGDDTAAKDPAAKSAAAKPATAKPATSKATTVKPATAKATTAKPGAATKTTATTKVAAKTPAAGSAGDKAQPAVAGAAAPAPAEEKPAAAAPAGSSPMAELKRSNLALDKALQKNRPNWSPEAELQRAEVRKIVGSFLDYGELARRALARHWEPLTPKQREEFVSTLRELVERSYLKQVHGNAAYNIKYEKEEKTGNDATVTATLNTMARGKKVIIALEYKMLYKDGHWVVYDVLTDEQSMLENYRAEFNKIITKESFEALLKKMKKKLDEKEE